MEEGKSRIEKLSDKLNSWTRYQDPLDTRSQVKETETPVVEEKWQTPGLDEMLTHELVVQDVNPLIKKIFIATLVFFLIAFGVAIFVFMGGATFVSSKNVDINILGPATIRAGEVVELGVTISNTNNADLEFANLSIQYPQGSRNPDDTGKPLTFTKDDLGVIDTGSEISRNVRAVLLGSTGEVKEIKFSVQYKVKGSNATFYKDKIFEITIGDAPVALAVESPSFTTSGESFMTTVTVTYNSTEILKNAVLKVEYPHGYSALEAIPESISQSNVWLLGDLLPGSKKIISIRGQIIGENLEERTFRFYAGVFDGSAENPDLGVIVASLFNTVAINRPSIGLSILFNGENSPTYIAPDARTISTSIKYQNNLSEKIYNPHLEVTFSGAALDKSSISPGWEGTYDQANSKATWILRNMLGNTELAPGEGGEVNIKFASLPSLAIPDGASDIKLKFTISAVLVGASGQRPLTISENRTIKISSQVNFSSRALRLLSSFVNFGPVPPKVKEETSYTIVYSVGNTRGDMTEVKVTAKLGRNVKWIGASSFAGGGVSYDASTNVVTWDVGSLPSGTGFSTILKEQSYQLSLTPTSDQIGTAPFLLTDIVFSGRDSITGETITEGNPPLSTRLDSDPSFIQGDDIVVK